MPLLTSSIDRPAGKGFEQHRLLLGTHTSGQDQNYVQIAHAQLPTTAAVDGEENGLDTTKYDEDKGGKSIMYMPLCAHLTF